jgi:hypothetical protein
MSYGYSLFPINPWDGQIWQTGGSEGQMYRWSEVQQQWVPMVSYGSSTSYDQLRLVEISAEEFYAMSDEDKDPSTLYVVRPSPGFPPDNGYG